jgi:hypothetical protein
MQAIKSFPREYNLQSTTMLVNQAKNTQKMIAL